MDYLIFSWYAITLYEDVQCTILSKLPLKEVVRTSVLSNEWRYLWVHCPKLSFNSAELSGRNRCVTKFIDNVNSVLHRCHGEVVDELKVKFGFHSTLAQHVNSWVSFAAFSRTKVFAFDLEPIDSCVRDDRYIFPFQLLNNESISCLQSIQHSFPWSHLSSLVVSQIWETLIWVWCMSLERISKIHCPVVVIFLLSLVSLRVLLEVNKGNAYSTTALSDNRPDNFLTLSNLV